MLRLLARAHVIAGAFVPEPHFNGYREALIRQIYSENN